MKSFRNVLIVLITFVSFVLADESGDFISNISKQTNIILDGSKNQDQKYLDYIEKNVDVEWIAKFVLGQENRKISTEQFEQFKSVYKDYLLNNYISKIKDYNNDLKIVKTVDRGNNVFVVSITAKDKIGTRINVDFRVVKKSHFLITDIVAEGISFIGSQRTDIVNSIKTMGFDGMLEKMKTKK
ncbi:MAG: ABC transporter substrate-binding protein [Rickettsiales bacterium]|jgi:phospholipid transport system substrate-binding protein|nr:ABC transporter substrate-binding protein [Rickettsiales bacterium]